MNSTMMLVTSTWGPKKTFKLVPIVKDCPYNEGIFDPETKVLALISREKKQSMHMVAKLNEMGDPEYLKIGKRANGKEYKEDRKILETFYEYYIEDKAEIEQFINIMGVNAQTFDYKTYLDAAIIEPTSVTPIIQSI